MLVHLTDNTYTFNEVIQMELKILRVLNFQIHLPIATEYMDRFLRINACDDPRVSLLTLCTPGAVFVKLTNILGML